MEILPQDLGKRWHIAVARYRAIGTARFSMPPHKGTLGQFWAQGLDLPEEVAAATLPFLVDLTTPLVAGGGTAIVLGTLVIGWFGRFSPSVLTPTIFGAVLLGYLLLIALPRRAFRRLHAAPVRWEEIEALKGARPQKQTPAVKELAKPHFPGARLVTGMVEGLRGQAPIRSGDGLEIEYFRFIQDVIEQTGLSAVTENEIRRVLCRVGETVAGLPNAIEENDVPLEAVAPGTDRACAVENERRLRHEVGRLREDLTATIYGLRTLLPTLGTESPSAITDFGRFVALAASVDSVAAEAHSLAEARTDLGRSLYTAPATQPALPLDTVVQTRM